MKKNTPQETLLLPLIGRVNAQNKWPELFRDKHSKKIISALDKSEIDKIEASDISDFVYGARYMLNVSIAKDFIKDHPNATIVNLGCGLDSLFEEIDNGNINYYSVDFPEVIELRKNYFSSADRCFEIPSNILDFTWMDKINFKEENGILMLSAGVFYYFTNEELKTLLHQIGETLPGAVLSFDNESPYLVKKSNKVVEKSGISDAKLKLFVKKPQDFKDWDDKIKEVEIIKDFKASLLNSQKTPFKFKVIFGLLSLKPSVYQTVIRFKR